MSIRTVNIAELKNRLSYYLSKVKQGQEIIVRDRDLPVARLIPWSSSEHDDELLALAAQGKVRLGKGGVDEDFWNLPAPRVSPEAISRSIDEERHEK